MIIEINEILYHGSRNEDPVYFDERGFYLTDSFKYATLYSKSLYRDKEFKFHVIRCYRITRPVDILDLENKEDFERLLDTGIVDRETLTRMKTEDWAEVLDWDKKDAVGEVIRDRLHYDGFVNFESDGHYKSYDLFYPKGLIKKVAQLEGSEIKERVEELYPEEREQQLAEAKDLMSAFLHTTRNLSGLVREYEMYRKFLNTCNRLAFSNYDYLFVDRQDLYDIIMKLLDEKE